jgi:DNA transposition AAA+ family ATPase
VLDMIERGEILLPGGSGAMVLSEGEEEPKRVRKMKATYETETVRKVGQILDFAADNAMIAVVTGTFGVGKTEAVRIWRRKQRKVRCICFEFDEFSRSNKVEFIGQLADLLGCERGAGAAMGGASFRRVVEALREKPCLVVLDQCEGLSISNFQIIRQLWDRTSDAGVGFVLLAAPVLLARLAGSQAKDLGALTSRVGAWAPLRGMSKEEMAQIVKAEGVTEVDDAAFGLWAQMCGGSMRRLMRSLELIKARHSGKRVTEKTVEGVAAMLWGMQVRGIAEVA